MKKYKSKLITEALQLRWDTWSEMCNFINVGKLSNGCPEGCFGDKGQINLRIPTKMFREIIDDYNVLVDENDYIIKNSEGYLKVLKPDVFEKWYELIEEDLDKMGYGDTYN